MRLAMVMHKAACPCETSQKSERRSVVLIAKDDPKFRLMESARCGIFYSVLQNIFSYRFHFALTQVHAYRFPDDC